MITIAQVFIFKWRFFFAVAVSWWIRGPNGSAQVVYITAKQVISGRCSGENDCKMYRKEIILIYQFIINFFLPKKIGTFIFF